MFVESILSSKGGDVYSVATSATVSELVDMLAKHNIGAVLVLDDEGNTAGIISERDVVRQLARASEGIMSKPVSALMTKALKTCKPTDTLDTVMGIMTRGRFRHLPVMENGRLVGIISIGDVVKRKIEEVEHETEVLREYIAS
ncbi:CBS domain-containing protein [Pelagibacterium lentulum]|uniref:Inosine-5-monophosphate dehydrogenase n=1 Tax=Pelagibacterium lentulum TaxID=2029865 RepID=A0A916RCT5_9HYPH|nr:CBS domain-containing protein [Pelagibacterium lentulum]GGA45500.1 inosine-5-monophosphate dehydrogenase [Pelagibacterium lentulum]